jgi:hypothetical protein
MSSVSCLAIVDGGDAVVPPRRGGLS